MNLLACSGPNALAIITRNVEFAALQAWTAGALLAFSIALFLFSGRSSWFFPATIAVMMAGHPLWIVSPYRGDCGESLAQMAAFVTGLSATAVTMQFLWLMTRRRRAGRRSKWDGRSKWDDGVNGTGPIDMN